MHFSQPSLRYCKIAVPVHIQYIYKLVKVQ